MHGLTRRALMSRPLRASENHHCPFGMEEERKGRRGWEGGREEGMAGTWRWKMCTGNLKHRQDSKEMVEKPSVYEAGIGASHLFLFITPLFFGDLMEAGGQ